MKVRVRGWSHVDLMLLYIVVVWGSVFSVIKLLTAELPLDAVNGLRFVLIAAGFGVILVARRDFRLSGRDAALVVALGLVGFTAYQLLSSYGISLAVVAGSALILATTPVFATLFSGLFRVERVGRLGWLGVAVGFAGIAVIVVGEHGLSALRVESVAGELAVVAGAACWAAGAVISKPLMDRHSSIKITAYSSIVGSVAYLPFLWPRMVAVDWSGAGLPALLLILYWVLAGNVIGQLVRFYGVKRIGPHRATAFVYLVPFSAAAIGALVLGSPVGPHHLVGGAVVFAGIALTRAERLPVPHKPPAGAP